jgi:hypothetical protein
MAMKLLPQWIKNIAFLVLVLLACLTIIASGGGGGGSSGGGGGGDGTNDNTLFTLSERLNHHSYPKLFVQIQSWVETSVYEKAADWDLIIADIGAADFAPQFLGEQGNFRALNPYVVVLLYHSNADIVPPWNQVLIDYVSGIHNEWYMKDIYGERYPLFPSPTTGWNDMANLTTEIILYMPNFLNERLLAKELSDGIFLDWITENISWLNTRSDGAPCGPIDIDNDGVADSVDKIDSLWVDGIKELIANCTDIFPSESLVVGNGGWVFDETFTNSGLNGRMVEQFLEGDQPGVTGFGWLDVMRGYYLMQEGSLDAKTPLVMTNGTQSNYKHMRFGLTSTLMFNGYSAYTTSQEWSANAGPYVATWWYDEYSVDISSGRAMKSQIYKGYLGHPITESYNASNNEEILAEFLLTNNPLTEKNVWRRDFENGVVLINPSTSTQTIELGDTYRKIEGFLDIAFNDGSTISEVTLESKSGVILLNITGE